jgi:hypothetical protein
MQGRFDMTKKIWETHGQEGCDDCQWIANETDGDILICQDCDWEADDGQPSWEQEWEDFGEVYSDEY